MRSAAAALVLRTCNKGRRRLTQVWNARLHLQGAHVFSHAGVVLFLRRQIVELLKGRFVLPTDQLHKQKSGDAVITTLLPPADRVCVPASLILLPHVQ